MLMKLILCSKDSEKTLNLRRLAALALLGVMALYTVTFTLACGVLERRV